MGKPRPHTRLELRAFLHTRTHRPKRRIAKKISKRFGRWLNKEQRASFIKLATDEQLSIGEIQTIGIDWGN